MILKFMKKKDQVIYKDRTTRIIPDFSMETLKVTENQKVLNGCSVNFVKPHMLGHTIIPSKTIIPN